MTSPSLGTVPIDLQRLLETRMLIQANSGAGKSHALRRVLEQTAPLVQQLVIDPEGEFATLREKFDYIICAPSGADAVATPKTAAALAVALWRSGSSAVIDIYELQKHERVLFVRRFLEALTAAPKSAWHSTIVALDEIQDYCPEAGQAESAAAVVDVAARGRKRGLCLLGATQRIARLSKDAAAELLNKAIGRTGMDIDVKRAMAELGMSNYRESLDTLRSLEAGEFFVFGPALSRGVERTRFGPVVTTHPEIGQKALAAPPPASARVKAQLAKIEGLQLEATTELSTVETLTAEVTKLRRELTNSTKTIGVPEAEVQRRIDEAVSRVPKADPVVLQALNAALGTARAAGKQIVDAVDAAIAHRAGRESAHFKQVTAPTTPPKGFVRATANGFVASIPLPKPQTAPSNDGVSGPERRILDAIAWLESLGIEDAEQPAVAFLAGYSFGGGAFNNPRGRLNQRQLVEYRPGGLIRLTDAGRQLANAPPAVATNDELHERVLSRLSGPEQRLLRPLLESYPRSMSNNDLAAAAGYTPGAGAYNNPRGKLRTLCLIDYPQAGHVVARALLFPKGTP